MVAVHAPIIRVTDLFAGAGGFTEGILQASPRYVASQAVEWDIDAAATYQANFPTADVVNSNIIDWVKLREFAPCDLLIGGPPCQGFSTLGKQDETDEKNLLWREYAEVVGSVLPSYFIMENVPQFERSPQKAVFIDELKNGSLQNYTASIWQVNSADYGSPQKRKRMIILGSRKDVLTLRLPTPTRMFGNFKTVSEAFANLDPTVTQIDLPARTQVVFGKARPGPFNTHELHVSRNYSTLSLARFAKIKSGGNRFDLPDELKAPCWRKHTTGSGDVMGRMHLDRPSVTIRTEFNKPEKGRYLHPTEDRAITHLEAARLMGFRDDYKWFGTKTSIARQIGNAVPIELGKALGEQVAKLL